MNGPELACWRVHVQENQSSLANSLQTARDVNELASEWKCPSLTSGLPWNKICMGKKGLMLNSFLYLLVRRIMNGCPSAMGLYWVNLAKLELCFPEFPSLQSSRMVYTTVILHKTWKAKWISSHLSFFMLQRSRQGATQFIYIAAYLLVNLVRVRLELDCSYSSSYQILLSSSNSRARAMFNITNIIQVWGLEVVRDWGDFPPTLTNSSLSLLPHLMSIFPPACLWWSDSSSWHGSNSLPSTM